MKSRLELTPDELLKYYPKPINQSDRFGLKTSGYMEIGMALHNAYYHKEIGIVDKDELDGSDLRQLLEFMWHVTRSYEATISTLIKGKKTNKDYLLNIYDEYKDIYKL